MREQPWHFRRITHEHELWFSNLRDIHALSSGWLAFAKLAPSKLDAILATELGRLMDDTLPEDVLGRLEARIWAEQARAWQDAARARATGSKDLDTAGALLLERSHDEGERVGARDWAHAFAAKPATLEQAFAALTGSAIAGRPGPAAFLICRSVENELEADLLRCPHSACADPSLRERADSLCAAHLGWMKGYVRALNRGLAFDSRSARAGAAGHAQGRCGIRLTYLN